jgi:hypothetical protein
VKEKIANYSHSPQQPAHPIVPYNAELIHDYKLISLMIHRQQHEQRALARRSAWGRRRPGQGEAETTTT